MKIFDFNAMHYKVYQWITTFTLSLFGSASKTDRNVFTPFNYPLLTSPLCSKEYLKLAFICDPNHSLSHTEASKINKTFNYNKFSPCTSAKAKSSPNAKTYTFGLALANFMLENDTDCDNESYEEQPENDVTSGENESIDNIFSSISNNIANTLRGRWSNVCDYDILIFVTEHLELCPKMLPEIKEIRYVGIASSERLQTQSLSSNIAKDLRSFKSVADKSMIDLILNIFSALDDRLPYLDNRTNSIVQIKRAQSVIPNWALIVFVVCLSLTFVCTALGHWVNTGNSRGRFHSPTVLFARGHPNDRRWRAGFAGGMMELHSAQQNPAASGGRQSSRNTNGNMRKGKMFGAIAMGNKKTNSAQYNYQRV